MRVAVPHNLPREEVRRRLRERSHEIADHIPGGMAEVETDWVGEDRMAIAINAMGQSLTGHIDVEDSQMVFQVELPMMLSFIEPIVEKGLREKGAKLLAPPRD
ncbi:MAG: polyhydroxyalkanoic acid system family protein [Sphingomonadaceae bacterium]|jgi:hypothetical protein|nr:polyhydroxyalkanoic acid system family protein [Sphingomonadaceae bacterium]